MNMTRSPFSSECRLIWGRKCNLSSSWQNGQMRAMDSALVVMWSTLSFMWDDTPYALRPRLGSSIINFTRHPPSDALRGRRVDTLAIPPVLRGIIAHQGQELISGHYVTMLVEGEAVWVADDGSCPEVHKEVPVMVWASRAEHSQFWTTSIGHFEPPQKKTKHPHQEIEILYANITQWTRDAEWLI